MEYAESLLEEYYDLSENLRNQGNHEQEPNLFDTLSAMEEEICWEFSLPASPKNRQLFQMTSQFPSKLTYLKNTLQTLEREKIKFFYTRTADSDFWGEFQKNKAA
ncbi:hypothetical protein P3G55_00770 [Leptospira sp. 96542]|nr:hypothetical protein [Leptospira sp. 96542]